MKILIVDDEELTRNGLVVSIDWKSLGITRIFQADDGIKALECVLENQPEIILCDVRMPRMDGITFAEKVQKLFPDTVLIFMSGYSDKEYLKAAIRLKALSYVEKPLNPLEIEAVVRESIGEYQKKQQMLKNEAWRQQEKRSNLAVYLTFPYDKNADKISALCRELGLQNTEDTVFTAFLVKTAANDTFEPGIFRTISILLSDFLAERGLSVFPEERHEKYMVFHISGTIQPSSAILNEIGMYLRDQFSRYGNYYFTRGKSCRGIRQAYCSFESAALLMQSNYFFGTGLILAADDMKDLHSSQDISSFLSRDLQSEFAELLAGASHDAINKWFSDLHTFFFHNTQILADQARDLYYKLFSVLQITLETQTADGRTIPGTLIRFLENFVCYEDMHAALLEAAKSYITEKEKKKKESSTILLIKNYIENHYGDASLSVKSISEHVFLSASYLCTFFKAETGQTLNQYITEYRMEKAKALLLDPRSRISDVSSRVGYNDGNYFGKSFKKYTGFSPSEFREKTIQ